MGDQLSRIRHLTEDTIIDRLRRDELRGLVLAWLRVALLGKRLATAPRDPLAAATGGPPLTPP